jgi:hypothetical protein
VKFKGLKVGDKVYVQHHQGGAEVAVTKVGRKYFTAGRTELRLEDGSSTSGYSTPHAFTLAEREMSLRVDEAKTALRKFGIDLGYSTSSDKILLVFEALKPHMASESPREESK